jgi:hypothetical protein
MKPLHMVPALAILLTVSWSVCPASDLDLEFDPARFSSSTEPGTFRTSIRWGAITVRGHDSPDVLVHARITCDRNRPATAAQLEELIELRLGELDNLMELHDDSRIDGFYGIDLEVTVPRQTRLELEMSRGGEIRVGHVDGEVDVVNRNGSVELSALGSNAVVDARNGSITAQFSSVDPALPMSFSTLNGSVDVTLPDDAAADLRIRHTYGGVQSDFPLRDPSGQVVAANVEDLSRDATRVLRAELNGGGPRYSFYTANGTVYLRRGADGSR